MMGVPAGRTSICDVLKQLDLFRPSRNRAVGTALAGEVTTIRPRVPGAASVFRGVRARHKERLLERYRRMQTWQW